MIVPLYLVTVAVTVLMLAAAAADLAGLLFAADEGSPAVAVVTTPAAALTTPAVFSSIAAEAEVDQQTVLPQE